MCDERGRLLDYLYDACDADERRSVEQHLDGCEACRDEISGLRAVRLDLLAWDVPEHGSVFKPFVPPRLNPWYREVPAWALVAAASVMFLLGVAGGLVSRGLLPSQRAAAAPADPPGRTVALQPPITVTPSTVEVAAMQQRIDRLEAALSQRVQAVPAHGPFVPAGLSREETLRLIATSEERQRQALTASMRKLLQDSQATFMSNSQFNNFVTEFRPWLRSELTQVALQQGSKQ